MSNIKSAGQVSTFTLACAVLVATFGLVACLSGGGSGGEPAGVVGADVDSAPPSAPVVVPGFPTPPAIPAAPFAATIAAIVGVPGSIRITTDTTGMHVGDSVEILQAGARAAYVTPYDGGVTPGAYEGIFTVTAMSPDPGGPGGTFDVAITFTTPAGASTQIIAGGTPPACATTGGAADLTAIPTVAISASRYVGVAPLGVYFDSTGTVGTATTRPFHELDYRWDFDDLNFDPAIGNWGDKGATNGSSGSGSNTSRRTDSGPVAAHVYEKPGTYRVRLTVKDVNGKSVTNNCVQIAVQDPEAIFAGKTACFSNDADFTGCPLIPATYASSVACLTAGKCITTSNFVTAMANDTTYKRLLFKRTHTFDVGSRVRMSRAGPGLVGAFGAGAAPRARLTYNGDMFGIGGASVSDWRIVDLNIDLNSAAAAAAGGVAGDAHRALRSLGQMTDIVLQRLYVHDGLQGYVIAEVLPIDRIFIMDTTFANLMANPTNGQAVYVSGSRVVYMGNMVNTTRSHNSRFPFLAGAVLSHNFHSTPGPTTSNMKIPGPDFTTFPGTYTENVVVSSNKYVSGSSNWMVELQPQSRHNDERLRNIIVEKNLFEAAAGFNSTVISVSGSNITLRNNIVNISASTSGLGFGVGQFGLCAPVCEPRPENIDIFHNTFYTSAGNFGSTLKIIQLISSIATPALPATWGVRVQNNLGYVPNMTPPQSPKLIDDLATGTITSNNSADADLRLTAPAWVSLTPSTPAQFGLTAPSYLAGDGTVPVMSDFFGAARPKPSPPGVVDIGATEF